MSGHSKFANIKHKKEKMMLQRVRSLQLSDARSLLQLKKEERIRQITAAFVMSLQKQKQTTCQMIQSNVVSNVPQATQTP